jgi:nucleoside-diphosphate-sugar epimerase
VKVLVTGANGFVGGRVLGHLLGRGVDAIGLARTGRTLEELDWPRREVPAWTEGALSQALIGIDVMVHAASVVHRPGASVAEHQAFNVEGTRSLLAAARSRGVRRIVFLSTIKVYGENATGTIDESTAVDRSSPYAATKLEAEQILLRASQEGGPSCIVLRLCPVYGAGDKGNVRRVAIAVAKRRFVVPGDGSTRKSVVHISSVAEAILWSLRSAAEGVFVVADRVAPSMRELGDTIACELGLRPPPSVPVAFVLALAGAFDVFARLRGRDPSVSPELIRKSLRSSVCSPAKLEQAMGLGVHVNLRDGIREEIVWLRNEGLL